MTINQAKQYHQEQINTLKETEFDLVSAYTMNYVEEAIGVVLAAKFAEMPVVISFTTEVDGRLPSGQSFKDALKQVDMATEKYPAYYMINCAHPTHFNDALRTNEAWVKRIRAIRANASCKTHAELDAATELDPGNPIELGEQYKALKNWQPHLNIFGGCCGTDHHHIQAISIAVQQSLFTYRCNLFKF